MIKEVSASTTLADAAAASLLWLLSPEKVAYPNWDEIRVKYTLDFKELAQYTRMWAIRSFYQLSVQTTFCIYWVKQNTFLKLVSYVLLLFYLLIFNVATRKSKNLMWLAL